MKWLWSERPNSEASSSAVSLTPPKGCARRAGQSVAPSVWYPPARPTTIAFTATGTATTPRCVDGSKPGVRGPTALYARSRLPAARSANARCSPAGACGSSVLAPAATKLDDFLSPVARHCATVQSTLAADIRSGPIVEMAPLADPEPHAAAAGSAGANESVTGSDAHTPGEMGAKATSVQGLS